MICFRKSSHLLTRGQPEANAAIPALEIHIALVRDLIVGASLPLVEIPPVPEGCKFIACLTHDAGPRRHPEPQIRPHDVRVSLPRHRRVRCWNVCRDRKTWRQLGTNWLAALKLPLVHLGLAGDFWHPFDHYLEIENGVNSTFFVIPKKGEPGTGCAGESSRPARAASYEAAGLAEPLKKLQSAGDEIARSRH